MCTYMNNMFGRDSVCVDAEVHAIISIRITFILTKMIVAILEDLFSQYYVEKARRYQLYIVIMQTLYLQLKLVLLFE